MARSDSDENWERERMLDRAFEQEPRDSRRRRTARVGARVRTALIGAREETVITCPCGFVAAPGIKPDSSRWHREHRDAHLARYPNVDNLTRENLDDLVARAERGEMVKRARVS
jgi:hypothetical protein